MPYTTSRQETERAMFLQPQQSHGAQPSEYNHSILQSTGLGVAYIESQAMCLLKCGRLKNKLLQHLSNLTNNQHNLLIIYSSQHSATADCKFAGSQPQLWSYTTSSRHLPSRTPTLFCTTHSVSFSQPLAVLPSRKHCSTVGCWSSLMRTDIARTTVDWWMWLCSSTSSQSKPTTRCNSSQNLQPTE